MREFRHVSGRIILWTSLVLILGCSVSGCSLGSTSAASRGRELFQNCAPCHQPDGSGDSELGAPNIAGMKAWYVEEELQKFRTGARGMHFSDVEGMRMRPIALSLVSDDDVKLVAAYVETMPPVPHPATLPGNAQAGAALFTATCGSCHGNDGAGNKTLKAPQVAGVDDWYLATELRKYKSGVRGANPLDREGRLMRPLAQTLADDDAIRNVIAYIDTLKH